MADRDRIIKSVKGRQVFTMRNVLGIEATIETEGGIAERAVCNSGISIGTHEVAFKYDGGAKWGGKGVQGAVHMVNTDVNELLKGMDATDQGAIDAAMIEAGGKTKWGGNAVAAVSAAALKAGAAALGIPLYRHIGGANALRLPVPGVPAVVGENRWGGGVTTTGNKPSISFMCYGFQSFADASCAGWDIYQAWRTEMRNRRVPEGVDMFFDVIPGIFKSSDEEIFELMARTIIKAGYDGKAGIQIDCAGDTYYDKDSSLYRGLFTTGPKSRDELMSYYKHLVKTYPFVVIEDPFHEDDYESHAILTRETDIQIVGDDLFTTMKERVKKGSELGAANAVLLKVNQVGSISEAMDMIRYAYGIGYGIMPCDSRGEGMTIADYCVGINAGSVREVAIGKPAANRFLEIEAELGSAVRFWGKHGLKGSRFQN